MIEIILSLILGISIGWFFKIQNIKLIEKSYTLVIYLLILFMGISIGSNRTIFENISLIGGYALSFAVVGIIGSIAGIIVLNKIVKLT